MTKEKAKKAAEIMMAFVEGKEIEFLIKGKTSWEKCFVPLFDWDSCDYRIKQEPVYRPFKDKDECWNEMLKHQPFGWVIDKNTKAYYSITALNDVCSNFSGDCEDGYSNLFKCSVFTDGTPFGIKEEQL